MLRYQTDHDEAGRATSCGPRTSRLVVKVLAEESVRLGVPVLNRCVGAKILTAGDESKRVTGLLIFRAADRAADNPLGLAIIRCAGLVIAAGGPGELYRDSVYPKHCFGALGLALEAGVEAVNLTESQFGIGTPRDGFPWNLSGTYAQCLPYIHSVDTDGTERNFLGDYYRTTQELVSNIFRKGYQWPFHASRMLDFGSSLVDLAIYRETRMGRKVLMDFNAIGEAAGTHGVTRPGGAALNAGQVMGQRCAEHIRACKRIAPNDPLPAEMVRAAIQGVASGLRDDGLDWRQVAREVQARMSDDAGFMCSAEGVRKALMGARRLNGDIQSRGLRLDRADQAERCVQWRQLAFASEAV